MRIPQPDPTTEALNTLREKLREMFHFAHNDLDFGIFRILKIKRDEVNLFIDEKLTAIVDEALAAVTEALYESQLTEVRDYVDEEGGRRQKAWLENIAENRQELIDFLQGEEQEELIAPLETDPDELKAHLAFRVYNHVHNFFERYYRDGDFGYNDRSTALYKVDYPDAADYDGADTLFHWKCRDSYYIKTATGFNSVAFAVESKRIEYRLEGKPATGIAQNNNRDDFKHYRLDRIEAPAPDVPEQTWGVILHLAESSTPKVDIYREINAQIFSETDDVACYLHERPKKGEEQGKPIFKDLADTYNKVQNGRLQGINALRLNLADYAAKLAERPEFRDLGKNKTARQATLQERPTVRRFHAFDKNLNTFFVGMDSDYFIHKDLDKFLKTEQRRYIQNSILGDLDTLLNLSPENPTFAVAKAFRADNGNRKFILVEMDDYFDNTLKERIRRAMFSENWKTGKLDAKKKIEGTVGIVKYQRLEQYEDVLNNLTIYPPFTSQKLSNSNNSDKVPIPVKYLYRPEEQQIRLMMDMRARFLIVSSTARRAQRAL